MKKNQKLGLVLITPVFIIVTHYIAMLPHEYMHSFMAWFLGDKSNPLDLNYGGTSWTNLLLLIHMDENVNYELIRSMGYNSHIALIAFAGAGLANIPLFFLSLWLLQKEKIKNRPYLYYFLFLFNLMNLGNFYDYVPIRTFSTHGDVAHFVIGLSISPWWVYIIGGYLVFFAMWQFFTKTMIRAYVNLGIDTALKASLMIICVGILFGFYGLPGFFGYGEISYFLSATSLIIIPGLIFGLWPMREWVTQRIQKVEGLHSHSTS